MKDAPHLGLARKYRPQTFDDLVGQEAIATTLRNAIESKQAAHAYLFYGPKGVGKTTTARILAKALNCKKGPTIAPCLECPACEEIAAGNSIDVLELDAASNTQVDKVREMIIETVSLAPSRDRSKIFIVDEVHMLTTSSFNALLKTLEEPPPHVVFILATTELSKIPATIVSRCQRFRFRPIPRPVLVEHLKKLARLEKATAEPAALELLARAAGGGLRDAVSLFDQAAAYGGGKVTAASVRELMGTMPEEFLLGIAGAVLAKDARALSQWIAQSVEEGFDPGQLLRDFRERLEGLYRAALGVGEGLDEDWAALAKGRGAEAFSFLIRRVNRALEDMRFSDTPQIAFELGLYGMLESAQDLGDWVRRLEALEQGLPTGGAVVDKVSTIPPAPVAPKAAAPTPTPAPTPVAKNEDSGPVWQRALARLAETKPSLTAILAGSRLAESSSGPWRLLFSQSFNMDRAKASQAAIEAELSSAAGRPVSLAFELAPKAPGAAPEPAATWVDASADDPADDPAVKKVLGVFGGRVKPTRKGA
ncbi:MAG TPA: DNA polymerase III subunit gamma/tau [Elusimicrobiota bacterium]|jgi:DNA polymerase-3 subunit gamma/tau|nr:DNA polymerase III subunit gamma/tau [Elusimicrobiota bacterium]